MEEYVQKLLILVSLLISLVSLHSLEWTNAVPIRQGVNIEWFRTGTETNDGCVIYVWSDTKLGARDLYAQKVDAMGNSVWGDPIQIDGKPDRQEDPVITKTTDGNFIIAWIDFSDDLDGNVYAQKINTQGQLLWPVGGVPVCVYPGIQISLNIEPDNDGGAYIVWEESRNPGKDIYGQRLSSIGQPVWTVNGIPIANGPGDESYNTMWADGTGGMVIAYIHALGASKDLFVKRFLPNGQMAWTQPLALSPHSAVQEKIKMAPMNNDSFVFTWMDWRSGNPDIHAQRVSLNGDVMWTEPFVVYTDSLATIPAQQENPRIIATSDNGVIIAWEDMRNDFDSPDLYVQKLNTIGQKLWNPDGVALVVADFDQKGPRLSADNNGGAFIVWDDSRNGNAPNIDIYAQHISSIGSALWLSNGLPICTAPNQQSGSLVKTSGNNVFINWEDMRNGSVGIYYQVLNFSGLTQLPDNGSVVFWGLSGDASVDQVLVLERNNDIAIIWQDTRFANLGYQIFYQNLNSDGSIDYEVNGRPLTTLTGSDQINPAAVVLPDDKIAVVWEENRTGNPKIFGQLLDSNGNRLWGETGISITDSDPLRQKDPKISYFDGAIYIGWSNLDDVMTPFGLRQYFHIYGQKIVGNQKMWGSDGVLVSEVPTSDVFFECQLESVLDRYFVWTRTSTNPQSFGDKNVWAKLVTDTGSTAPGWSNFGIPTSNYNDWDLNQYLPKAVLTNDGLFVSWADLRTNFTKKLYGQLISSTGQLLWDPSGVYLSPTSREQDEISLLGGDHVTFTWKESITGSNEDIAIQRYSTDGIPMWGDLGFYVVQRDTTQSSPFISRFNNGGMVVVWEDFYDEDADIFLRFIEQNGTLTPGEPIIVCEEIMPQRYPKIAILRNEYPNRAIVVWSDGRSSGKTPIFGLYAQKVINSTTPNIDEFSHFPKPVLNLKQNYPNPFNPETKLEFNVSKNVEFLEFSVFNLKGQKIKTLHKGITPKGNYSFIWNGKDEHDNDVACGVYFYKLSSGSKSISKKMVLMK